MKMKKIFTKFSLLCIGLMLCMGTAWATGTYHDPANPTSGQDYDGYYEETINGVTYRIDYTYRYTDSRPSPQLPNYYTIKRTPVSEDYPSETYTYKAKHAYVTNTFNGSSPAELEFVNSISIITNKMVNDMVPGNPTFNFETTTAFPVCLKKNNFDGYSGKIKLPAFPEDGKVIVFEGWSVADIRYDDPNYGDAFNYVFGNNVTVEVPTLEDQAKYEAQSINYKGNALNAGGWGISNNVNTTAYPWNSHLTNRGESAPFDYIGGGTDGTISWTILSGKLSVLGTGAMPNYSQGGAPWHTYADKIYAVEIGENITSIGEYAFYELSNLTNVIFAGNQVTTIGAYAFQYTKVRKINFPTGVTTINAQLFSGTREFISAVVPATVTTMAEGTFASPVLREVTLLNANPTSTIHTGALTGTISQYSLAVIVPEDAVCAYTGRFPGKTFKSYETGETIECTGPIPFADGLYYQFSEGVLTISGNGTTIPDYSYYGSNIAPWLAESIKNNLTSVVFETTNLETIGNYAFYQCTNAGFTSITIPNTVTTLRGNVFNGCSHLATVTLGSSVTSVGSNVFKSCPLTSPVYNSHIFVCMPNAYFTAQGVDSYDIPNVETIASSAFSGCSNMHSVTIPNTVTSIGSSVFSSTGLTSMPEFPSAITAMPEWAFQSCTGLTNVEIPTHFTSISSYAFYGCSNLESVTIPNSVTSIGSSAFYNCSNLESITIPNSVTLVDNYAFQNCTKLVSVDIPNSVTTTGYGVFRGCTALASVKLPAGLTEIKNYTFRDCSALSNLYLKGTSMATIGMNVFQNCTTAMTVHVPAGSLEYYTNVFDNSSYKPSSYTIVEESSIRTFSDESAASTNATLVSLLNEDLVSVVLARPAQKGGQYNTLCLPFSLSEEQIAKSSLATAEIFKFSGATKDGDELELYFQPVTELTAGVPYFFRFMDDGANLSMLSFADVTVATATAGSVTHNGVTLIGTLSQVSVSGSNKLYLAANNELHWSSSAKTINPFRAYFSVAGLPAGARPRARIVEHENVATDIESAQTSAISSQKVIENGQLYIIRNGVRYNAAGQVVK